MNKKTKPSLYSVEKELNRLLTDMTPIGMIDGRWMDTVIYHYPNKWLQFISKRERREKRK